VSSAQCPVLKQVSLKENACFGSTSLGESGFQIVKIPKSKHRPSVSDMHLTCCRNGGITKYISDYNKLDEEMQYHVSH
jgi:hypothetical protein